MTGVALSGRPAASRRTVAAEKTGTCRV